MGWQQRTPLQTGMPQQSTGETTKSPLCWWHQHFHQRNSPSPTRFHQVFHARAIKIVSNSAICWAEVVLLEGKKAGVAVFKLELKCWVAILAGGDINESLNLINWWLILYGNIPWGLQHPCPPPPNYTYCTFLNYRYASPKSLYNI